MVKLNDVVFKICLDSGATVSFVTINLVTKLGVKVLPNNQLARLADNSTRMKSLG